MVTFWTYAGESGTTLSVICDAFPINMSGVEDSVENYQSYLVAYCAVMVFESCEIFFVRFVIYISIS